MTVANSEISYNQSALANGGYPLGTVASFTCFDGFNLFGFESGTCRATGRFSHTPACGNEMNTLVFFLNGAELSLNSLNSEKLINH